MIPDNKSAFICGFFYFETAWEPIGAGNLGRKVRRVFTSGHGIQRISTSAPSSIPSSLMEATSTSAAMTVNLFRYDSTSNQYVFNLGTKSLSTGTWQIRIELDDGNSKYVTIGLK